MAGADPLAAILGLGDLGLHATLADSARVTVDGPAFHPATAHTHATKALDLFAATGLPVFIADPIE
jgi:hypothetical protein